MVLVLAHPRATRVRRALGFFVTTCVLLWRELGVAQNMPRRLRGGVLTETSGAPGAASQLLSKVAWSMLSLVGARRVVSILFPAPTRSFFDVAQHPGVRGYVALTFDDAFLRSSRASDSMVEEVRRLLRKHNASATFFVTSSFVGNGAETSEIDEEIAALVRDGNELGNHLPLDRPYHEDSRVEFESELDKTARTISRFHPATRWFRAPHGRLSSTMSTVLADRGLINVMTDAYANDPHVPDPQYIAKTVLKAAQDGSIVLIHMPERHFRQWNIHALQLILEGLSQRQLRAVTVSTLFDASSSA